MSNFNYEKIARISFSSSSSGMAMGSNQSHSEEILWKDDGTVILQVSEVKGTTRTETVYDVSPELAEQIRKAAEEADMASWSEWKHEVDPRFICTDYSSSAGGSIFLDNRGRGGMPFEMKHFDRASVYDHGKGEDLEKIEALFMVCQIPEKQISTNTTNPGGGAAGFMGLGMMTVGTAGSAGNTSATGSENASATVSPDGSWTCSCGTKNTGKFCCECGRRRPE
ncbi:MAG: hypothetical protein J5636_11140 [Clostridiales bacterium]|nr:hypothetical protein [Clostridiales bacterium]